MYLVTAPRTNGYVVVTMVCISAIAFTLLWVYETYWIYGSGVLSNRYSKLKYLSEIQWDI